MPQQGSLEPRRRRLALWACLVWGASALPAAAADPQLGSVTPSGGQRGTELDVVLAGARLADAQELLLYYPGIRALKVEPQKDGSVKARLAIAADCRLGQHALRLRTAGGISNLATFSVGPLAELAEVEPNNDFDKPQAVPLNITVSGVVQNEDVDYFVVDAKKGQRIVAEIEGFRLGLTTFDPSVSILDTRRFALAEADDTPLAWQDSVAAASAPADGKYLIQVRESAFGGNGACRYRLHVGTFPRPLAVYPAGGVLGQSVDVRWLGDLGDERAEKVALPAVGERLFGLVAKTDQGIAPSPNPFRLGNLPNVLETEPNDAAPQATAGPAPAAFNGVLSKPGDVDCFKFPAKAGQVFDMRVHARSIRSPVDPVLQIARSNGQVIAGNDDSGSPDSYLRFQSPADGEYVVLVSDQLQQGASHYVYRVEVASIEPKLTLGLVERQQFVDVVLPVPAGNRIAAVVSAQREDFEGEVKLELKGLPPGVTAETLPMPGDQTVVPLLLTAPADAKPSGALVDLVGRHESKDRKVEGRLNQKTMLVRGQNNREVWSHQTDRMAVAVAEAVPFRIEIVEPKAPLVQSGSMELKVAAVRQNGFKASITLRMLYNPPGVSAPASATIPEGQAQAVMPLTADGGAKPGAWKIAVLAEAPTPAGPALVSSQLANLTVAEPYFKFSFPPVVVEKGQATQLAVKIEKLKDFEGKAAVELLGLPNEVTSQPREFAKEATEIVFPLTTTAKSPAGLHKTLLCRAVAITQGEPVTHTLGTGELRIQEPVVKPAQAAPPKVEPKPQPAKPAEKRLSRLEQLRLEKQQVPNK